MLLFTRRAVSSFRAFSIGLESAREHAKLREPENYLLLFCPFSPDCNKHLMRQCDCKGVHREPANKATIE